MEIIKKFSKYFAKYRLFFFLSIVCAIGTGVSGLMGHFYSGKALDAMPLKGEVNFPLLLKMILIMLFLYILEAVTNKLLQIFSNRMAYRAVRDIRNDAFNKLEKLPLSYLDTHPHGDIISRFINDMDSVSEALSAGLTSALSGLVELVACTIIMFSINSKVAWMVILMSPLNFLVAALVARFSHSTYARQQSVMGDLSAYASEKVGDEKIVMALGYEKETVQQFAEISENYRKLNKKAQFISAITNPAARFIDHLTYILIGIVGGLTVLSGGLSIGMFYSFIIYASQFQKPFNEISGITAQLQTAYASLRRMFSFLEEPEEAPDKKDALQIQGAEGAIQFTHVKFSYQPDKPIIKDLSLTVEPGELIAIVGKTGAGKTTLVNLLMRFYEIDKGKITLDKNNTRDITRDSLRHQFGMVLQESWLFEGTVADNIAYGKPDATREEIIKASKSAYAHSFVMQLDGGYDAVLEEEGNNLSGGQKQLLTIARVMLMDPPMLILDEATSSVDSLTEVRIQKALNKMMENRTSFVIAHRLSTIVNADKILVMEKGDIVEQGPHKELLEKKGAYASLYYSQFK